MYSNFVGSMAISSFAADVKTKAILSQYFAVQVEVA